MNDILEVVFQTMKPFWPWVAAMFVINVTLQMIRLLIDNGNLGDVPENEETKKQMEQNEINHAIIQPYPKQRKRIYKHVCKQCGGPTKYFTCEWCGSPAYPSGLGGEE